MASRNRVLVIGLDGAELSYLDGLMADGELPNLAALRDRSASFLLESPPERRTGLEWEHLTAALPEGRALRDSQVDFDPNTYDVRGVGRVATDGRLRTPLLVPRPDPGQPRGS